MIRRSTKNIFSLSELEEMAKNLIYALHAGNDLKSAFKRALTKQTLEQRDFFQDIEIRGLSLVLKERLKMARDFRERIFYLILLQETRSQELVFKLLENYITICSRLKRVERKRRSLLFLPKFQSGVSLVVTLFMIVGLPWFSPLPLPTFFSLGRADLFVSALALILVGLWLMAVITNRIARMAEPHFNNTFFIMHFRILVEAGKDLVSSWNEAVSDSLFSDAQKFAMSRTQGSNEDFEVFLRSMHERGHPTLKPFFMGLSSALATVRDLTDFIKSYTDSYTEEWFETWEFQVQKASGLLMLPLLFFVFPASLFLLLGPQLMEIQL